MKKLSKIVAWIVGITSFLALGIASYGVIASVNFTDSTIDGGGTYKTFSFFNTSTTTTATSTNGGGGYFKIAGARKVNVYYQSGLAANTLFNLQASYDGSTWFDYYKLISNTSNTNSQQLTRVGSTTMSLASTTQAYTIDPADALYAIRCIVVKTGAAIGSDIASCTASAEFK